MPDVRIQPMRAGDLDTVLEIERASFKTPWSRQAFLHELERNRVAGLMGCPRRSEAADGTSPGRGIPLSRVVVDEVHVTNLAVDPAWRGEGIGRRLLGTILAYHRAGGARRAFLEVRPDNAWARRLYQRLGFQEVGRRRGYYIDTGEDALLLEARLDEEPFAPVTGSRGWNPSTG